MRLLAGELPAAEARELRARLFKEPELAAAFDRLARTWNGLEPPSASPVPPGFAGRIMTHVRSRPAPGSLSWSAAPRWVRAAAAAALLAGAAVGLGVGRSWPEPGTSFAAASSQSLEAEEDLSLAGSYWEVVEDATAAANPEAEALP
jgi:anti-sigma factor RsiW